MGSKSQHQNVTMRPCVCCTCWAQRTAGCAHISPKEIHFHLNKTLFCVRLNNFPTHLSFPPSLCLLVISNLGYALERQIYFVLISCKTCINNHIDTTLFNHLCYCCEKLGFENHYYATSGVSLVPTSTRLHVQSPASTTKQPVMDPPILNLYEQVFWFTPHMELRFCLLWLRTLSTDFRTSACGSVL